MASLRYLASCIGLPESFSVIRDFFGYASPPPWKQAPSQANLPQSLSLVTQMKRLKQKHFHLNLIRVGTDGSGFLAPVDEHNLDCAVQITRDIYAAAGIGIGRVQRWWMIPLSDNTGFDVIDDRPEAGDLVDEFTVPNDGVDCFFVPVFMIPGVAGTTPAKSDGVVVESREGDFLGTARTMAHELGHYFGLGHENDKPLNLMCQTKDAKKPTHLSTHLNPDQIGDIMDHIKDPC